MADVFFKCRACAKNLVVDEQGAGLTASCPSCGTTVEVPGAPAAPATVAYICPACLAEVAMPEQLPDQTNPCPKCGSAVHFRRKLYLKPPVAVTLLPPPHRWRSVAALAILVVFAVLVTVVALKISAALR